VASTYYNVLSNGFVWDDSIFTTHRSEAYKSFDISTIFFTLSTNGLEYLPIRDVSYALDFALWGSNPAGFHFSNLLLFWLNVVVMYVFSIRLIQQCQRHFWHDPSDNPRMVAFFAAALFAIHPINGEAVNFITARNALLCGVFFFLSCYSYLRYLTDSAENNRGWYLSAIIFFILALFSKVTGIILPLILVIFTFAFHRQKQKSGWLPLLPFMFLSAAGFFFFKHVAMLKRVIDVPDAAETSATLLAKIAMAAQIPVFYLYKMLIPFNYSVEYDIHEFGTRLTVTYVAGSLAVLTGLVTATLLLKPRRHFLAFIAVWYLVSLLPVLHLFPTHPVVADRYAFLPSYPVFLLLASCHVNALRRFPPGQLLFGAVILISLAISSNQHNRVWKSDKSLWEYTVRTAPHSVTAHTNLARLYFIEENEYDKGLEFAKKAQQLNPRDTNYDVFQGVLRMRENDPRGAIAYFDRALKRNNQHIETLVNLSTAYQMLGERGITLEYLQRAVDSLEPDTPGDLRETAKELLRELAAQKP
jgi:tetratricopeptide (TPR) repeat protein